MKKLQDKIAIITGGSKGIGKSVCLSLSNAGASVLILDVDKINGQNLVDEILSNGNEASFYKMNVANENEWLTFIKFLKEKNISVDILINNAGTLLNKPFSATTFEDFKQVYNTNVFGVAELTRRMIPFMPKNGHVVTISSMGGVQGSVKFPGLAAYSSSKGAVITLTELLAEEYKESGPSFNVLALGAVQTEMLEEAFPGYEAPNTPAQMGAYIFEFAKNGQQLYNGKLLQISSSTP